MQNRSPAFYRDPSSLLQFEGSDSQSSSEICLTPKWCGCGGKTGTKFIPYMSDSSAIGDNTYSNHYNEPAFSPIRNNLATSNATISKYLQQTNVIPCVSDTSTEENKDSQQPEIEVNLRNSEDYEIHTITEESEQVTQTDIKMMTPSNFSNKPTPNKRYSSRRGSNLTGKTPISKNPIKFTFPNKVAIKPEMDFWPKNWTIEKDIQMLDYVSDWSSKNTEIVSEKIEPIIRSSSQPTNLKLQKKRSNKTLNQTYQKGGFLKPKAGDAKKGKCIKIKSCSSKGKKIKVANSSSVIKFPTSKDSKYFQHFSTATKLNSINKPQSNFLQRMEIGKSIQYYYLDLKIRNCKGSKDKKKDFKSKLKKFSRSTIKLLSNTANIQEYEFDNDLKSDSFSNRNNQVRLADWIKMMSVETNFNYSQKPTSFFDYDKLRTENNNDKTPHNLIGKSSSMVSLKCQTVNMCQSEVKIRSNQTPMILKKQTKVPKTQTKDTRSRSQTSSLDQNISTVLEKLKNMSFKGTEKKEKIRTHAHSWWSTVDVEKTDSVSSFISYEKNKYSVARPSDAKKSEDIQRQSIEFTNIKIEDRFLDYISHIKNSSKTPKTVIDMTQNHDVILTNPGTSERETCSKETDEGHESEGYIAEQSIHSSNFSDSYQSFSTMERERSECMDTNEQEFELFNRPTYKLKNPFL
jgi:Txe/YoeB family toxin of Txe-Axe toxin-antitoxin module